MNRPRPRTNEPTCIVGVGNLLRNDDAVGAIIAGRLEAELPAEDVHTWLKPLQAEQRSDAMVLYAPNAFIVEQVRERYLGRIRELLDYFAGHDDVSLEIGSRSRAEGW